MRFLLTYYRFVQCVAIMFKMSKAVCNLLQNILGTEQNCMSKTSNGIILKRKQSKKKSSRKKTKITNT